MRCVIVLRVLTLVREEAPMIAAGCVVALREGCAGCASCVNAVLADSVERMGVATRPLGWTSDTYASACSAHRVAVIHSTG